MNLLLLAVGVLLDTKVRASGQAGASSATNNFTYKDATGFTNDTLSLSTGATGGGFF